MVIQPCWRLTCQRGLAAGGDHQLSGGELGGLIRYREEVLDATLNSVGRLAIAMNSEINAQLWA